MAVPEQIPYKEYVANGTTTVFPLEFYCEKQEFLIVTVNGIEPENGQWSLTDNAVIFLTAPINQAKVIIKRDTPLERNTDYQTYNNSFRPEPVNYDFDQIWRKLQELGVADWLLNLKLDKEIADRIAADLILRNDLDAEVLARIAADTNLQNKLNTEIQARIDGDKSTLSSANTYTRNYFADILNSIISNGSGASVDSAVMTWSGRIQREKNKDVVSSFDNLLIDHTAGVDSTAAINNLINNNNNVQLMDGTVQISEIIDLKGHDNFVKTQAKGALTPNYLAHEQILKGTLRQETWILYDAKSFWRVGPTVAVWGDSNTAFCDASANRVTALGEGSYPATLEMLLKDYVYYAEGRVRGDGSPGQTAEYGWQNIESMLTSFSPQICIIAWGTNDISKNFTREQYIDYMRKHIVRLQTAGVMTIVLSIPYRGGNAEYLEKTKAWNTSLKRLCDEYDVRFVNIYNVFANLPATYFWEDNVHYQWRATRMIAERVRDVIIADYGLPATKFNKSLIPQNILNLNEVTGLTSTKAKALSIVDTANQYIKQWYPKAIKIPANTEISFTYSGPFLALFDRPASGFSFYVNDAPTTALSRGNTIYFASIAQRLDGSSGIFRLRSDADMYLLATYSADRMGRYVYTPAEINNALCVCGLITVSSGTTTIQSIVTQRSDSEVIPFGVNPVLNIQNIGTFAERSALTGMPVGFVFLQGNTFYRYNGTSWIAIA
ncbi:SGNH/GDSL hydrolase family protein [Acinetobacter corruptisaponis]|uniref:SGNH/GDSL hydrolase family protein n=1 Tax=Acinetobacter corruptisaponis TaxID=3045147 RepID=A0ABY8S557_9GAMM|nr:SGNH/GDSL hydrolase family protein [Acinetobacter sp. KCTC 92772]WHP06840.1 SGNH/GDSL hydrolase family protein [Acinetobacter sp. KCTC 92772]WHP06923.1 SGNH/GDSL hydrolase family protein [Acinetobacter sp. KCTC 92772]